MSLTIQETIHQLHGCLRDYIEATYHIGSPSLIAQRRELLARVGVIHQAPYIESTPRYQSGTRFSAIKGLPEAALTAFERLSRADGSLPALFYDPPYKHQSDAVRYALVERKNLLVMTGTGSGKTESFLLPILGKLAREAQAKPMEFRDRAAVRALILYPMNALVNDQLGRLRSIFGDARTVGLFKGWAGRPARFARYTSRTPYAGIRTREKDSRKLKAFDEFYVEIQRLAQSAPSEEQAQAFKLLRQLKERGKWPAKPDLIAWFGNKGSDWQDRRTLQFRRAIMLPDDVELITRHEVQASPPDLLVTNYSMLEYMLMRPVERTIFDRTSEWLRENPGESFLIVLDEAHLYRGAAGAEVGLLLRRLRDRLGIPPERFQVICATASFTDAKYAPKFGAQLAGVPANTFVAITGDYAWREHAAAGTMEDSEALAAVDLGKFYDLQGNKRNQPGGLFYCQFQFIIGCQPIERQGQVLGKYRVRQRIQPVVFHIECRHGVITHPIFSVNGYIRHQRGIRCGEMKFIIAGIRRYLINHQVSFRIIDRIVCHYRVAFNTRGILIPFHFIGIGNVGEDIAVWVMIFIRVVRKTLLALG